MAPPKPLQQSIDDIIARLPEDGSPMLYSELSDQVLATSDPNARDAMTRIVKHKLINLYLAGGQKDAAGNRSKPVLMAKRQVS